jgi:glutamate synthase (NADPH/NADH) small chain
VRAGHQRRPGHDRVHREAIVERGFAERWIAPQPPPQRSGKRVAVVARDRRASRPRQLNRAGHIVTVFEKQDRIGGLLRYGIPDFKLEKWVIDRRVDVLEAEGIEFRTGIHVGRSLSAKELLEANDALLLAGGAETPRDLTVPGRELAGVYYAMEFLEQQNRRVAGDPEDAARAILAAGKRVVVLGGGDTGSDCIGTSLRQGAAHVQNFELLEKPPAGRSAATPWPTHPAPAEILRSSTSHEEGGDRDWGVSTTRLEGANGRLRACTRNACASKRPGDGRSRLAVISAASSRSRRICSLALGFLDRRARDVGELGLELSGAATSRRGLRHSVPRVYAAGDMRQGQSLVVWAIAEGRQAQPRSIATSPV